MIVNDVVERLPCIARHLRELREEGEVDKILVTIELPLQRLFTGASAERLCLRVKLQPGGVLSHRKSDDVSVLQVFIVCRYSRCVDRN